MVKLSDAFKYNGTSSLTKFSELQSQCKNTTYFISSRPINHLSSWENYQCISSASLSKTSIASAGETITVSYNIPYRSGVIPTITSTFGTVSNITATDANGKGSAKITIENNTSTASKEIKVKISISPGNIETYQELTATQLSDFVKSDWTIVSYGIPEILYLDATLTPSDSTLSLICTCSNTWKRVWNSGKEETETRSVSPTVTIDKQYYSSSASATSETNITRFSLSGSELSHATMGTTEGYDYVVVKAVNPNDTSKYTTQSFNVRNKVESYTMSYFVNTTAGSTSSGSSCTFEADLTSPADYIVVYGRCSTKLTTGYSSSASASCRINSYPSWASVSNTNDILYVTDNTGPERSAVLDLQVRANINGVYEYKYFTLTIVQKGVGGQKFVGVLPMSITSLSGCSWELQSNGTIVLTGSSSDMSIYPSSYNTYINFNKIVDFIKSNANYSSFTLRFVYYNGPYPTYFNLDISSSSVSSIRSGNDFEGYFYDSY